MASFRDLQLLSEIYGLDSPGNNAHFSVQISYLICL